MSSFYLMLLDYLAKSRSNRIEAVEIRPQDETHNNNN